MPEVVVERNDIRHVCAVRRGPEPAAERWDSQCLHLGQTQDPFAASFVPASGRELQASLLTQVVLEVVEPGDDLVWLEVRRRQGIEESTNARLFVDERKSLCNR